MTDNQTMQEGTMFPSGYDIVLAKEEHKILHRKKVMKARRLLRERGVKRSGKNKYRGYDYYTIDDILDVAYPVLEEVGLSTWYSDFGNHKVAAKLEVMDLDTGYVEVLEIENPSLPDNQTNDILQNIGKSQTYLRKYLYILLFDISYKDIDEQVGKHESTPTSKMEKKPKQKHTMMKQKNEPTKMEVSVTELRYMIQEVEEKGQAPTRVNVRKYLQEQFDKGLYTQKEFNFLNNKINEEITE